MQDSTAACDDTGWQIKAQQLSFQVKRSDTDSLYTDTKQPYTGNHSDTAGDSYSSASASCSTANPSYQTGSAANRVSIVDVYSCHESATGAEAPYATVAGEGACSKASTEAAANNLLNRLEDSPLQSCAQSVSVMVDNAFSKTASASSAGQDHPKLGSVSVPTRSPCTTADSTSRHSKPAAFHLNRDSLDPFLTRHMCLQQLEALRGHGSAEVGVSGLGLPAALAAAI